LLRQGPRYRSDVGASRPGPPQIGSLAGDAVAQRPGLGAGRLQSTEHEADSRGPDFWSVVNTSYQAQLRSELDLLKGWEFDAALRSIGHVNARDASTGITKR